jgi:hypothetical protein
MNIAVALLELVSPHVVSPREHWRRDRAIARPMNVYDIAKRPKSALGAIPSV